MIQLLTDSAVKQKCPDPKTGELSIIPTPKSARFLDGYFSIRENMTILTSGRGKAEAELLRETIREKLLMDLPVQLNEKLANHIVICEQSTVPKIFRHNIDKQEGYCLVLHPELATISSNNSAGLFYGIQTFSQLINDQDKLPCCEIEDWPNLAVRGIHLDLKGVCPTFTYLKNLMKRLAAYKINTVLIEYEDKFKYRSHPEISADFAFTEAQIRELDATARRCHIKMIPLLQCLGHVQYILRHEKYFPLREVEGDSSQFCPGSPASLKLFKELAEEIIAAHPESEFFHIGADETRLLGKCPQCSKQAGKTGEIGVYLDYLNKVLEFIREKGKIPIIWDDIIRKHLDDKIIDRLPKDVVLMYWNYSVNKDEISSYPGLCSKEWLKKSVRSRHPEDTPDNISSVSPFIENINAQKRPELEKLYRTDKYPLYLKSLPYLDYYSGHKFKVIGAPSVYSSLDNYLIFGDYDHSFRNIDVWTKKIEEASQLGVISTIWARMSTFSSPKAPVETLMYGIVGSAEMCWATGTFSIEEFDKKFNREYFGTQESSVTDAVYLLETSIDEPYHNYAEWALKLLRETPITKNFLTHEYLCLAANIIDFKRTKKVVFKRFIHSSYSNIAGGTQAPDRLKLISKHLKSLNGNLEKLKSTARKVFRKTLMPEETEEKIDCLFGYDEFEINSIFSTIHKESISR